MSARRPTRAVGFGFAALAFAAILPGPSLTLAQPLDELFARGNAAFVEGDDDGAIQNYELLIEAGVEDPDVYFNLATARGRRGDYGQAVRYFEKTLRLRPGDEEAARGLSQAQGALGKRRAQREGEATVQTGAPIGDALVRPFSSGVLAILLLGSNLLFFGLLIAIRFTRGTARIGLAIAAPLLGLLALSSGLGLTIRADVFREGQRAVIVVRSAELREGPAESAVARGRAYEGENARILEAGDGWVFVRLSPNREGWIPEREAGTI
ncbi:MAG: tetratricopeptide repeat protein [Myxococcota bacterium]